MATGHGFTHVVRDGNIIRVTLRGAFNAEGADNYERLARDAIASLGGQPFLMLIDDTELEGGTPEAYQALNRFNQWQNTQPLMGKAFIVKKSVLKEIILQRTPQLRHQNTAFFDCEEDALQWLHRQLLTGKD